MTNSRHLDEIRRIHERLLERDFWGLLYEELTLAVYNAALGRGDTAIDCGGNRGVHTQAMARLVGPSGRVITFEPVPDLLLLAQTRNAGVQNVRWIAKAASKAPGTTEFFYYPNEDGLSGLVNRQADTSVVQKLSVEVTTIDSEVTEFVTLIKLDIEGAEFDALQGAVGILRDSAPIVVFESGRQTSAENFGYTAEEFFSFFDSLGYNLYFISGMPLTRELWLESRHPWQFLALHPTNPRSSRVLAMMHQYVANLVFLDAATPI